ncbi:hypothetical protein ACHAWU_005539 [Discostella pseudostelligera]|uniref:Uncharacterized protein n=1 Tax=Discostella pseudostelligera TaxID=259834 RepID=A0ABD3N0V4_9STRA
MTDKLSVAVAVAAKSASISPAIGAKTSALNPQRDIRSIMKLRSFNYVFIACTASMMMMATSASAFQLPLSVSSPSGVRHSLHRSSILPTTLSKRSGVRILLKMADSGSGSEGGSSASKQRRRKRKKSSSVNVDASTTTTTPAPIESDDDDVDETLPTEAKQPSAKALVREILAREQMMNYDEYEDLTSFTPVRLEEDDRIAAAAQRAGFSISGNSDDKQVTNKGSGSGTQLEDLFDSREFLQRKREKQIEENSASTLASTGVPAKKKIKRSDIKAYNKLLEMDPIADEDSSYFEDEGIDFISALLGDVEPGVGNESDENSNKTGKKVQKKTSFLGIGSGPLQVGHFIGALGVILMAFVEYPGFPLTNLPDPLRASLQGGLGTIYLINTILAIFAAMSAPSRNQSAILWGAKTFAVGGIAYDQLMQIPTPEEAAENARREQERLNKMSGRRGRRQK